MEAMIVRAFKDGDEPALQAVFYSAIHTIAARDYTSQQVDVWAPHRPNWDAWTAKMQALQPFVVEEGPRVVGYADLQANGHIDHFFVSGTYGRRGVGRLLMETIHAHAAEKRLGLLFADVSVTAQPFFKHFGFLVREHKSAVMGAVSLPLARMEKTLAAAV